MAGGANKAFLADPLGFMANNYVIVQYGGNTSTNVPIKLDLVEGSAYENNRDKAAGIDKANRRNRDWSSNGVNGSTQGVYYLTAHEDKWNRFNSHPITAYWLAYSRDTVQTCQLGPMAKFCFTAAISGCTVGIGDGAHPKIAHANKQDKVSGVMQINQPVMDGMINAQLPNAQHVLRKADYGIDAGRIDLSFFGVHNGNRWEFFTQSSNAGQTQKTDDAVTLTRHGALTRIHP